MENVFKRIGIFNVLTCKVLDTQQDLNIISLTCNIVYFIYFYLNFIFKNAELVDLFGFYFYNCCQILIR